MKLRNKLLAIICLLVFIGVGVLFFNTWVVQKPFGIILFVGDNLDTSAISAARLYDGGADHRLAIEQFPNAAMLTNYANDFAVPDEAAAASAIATGRKVNNRALSCDSKGKSLTTILELARKSGRAIGIVTNGELTDAGIAAFYAHSTEANDPNAIAKQLADAPQIDIILGGGAEHFLPVAKGGTRKDGHDLLAELAQKGRRIIRTKSELENQTAFGAGGLIGIFSNKELAYANQTDVNGKEPSLSDMTRRAIQFLQINPRGYILIVDTELGARAARQNDGEHAITELLDFDHAISTAEEYAGEKTLLIATGKVATGGMTLNGFPLRQDHGITLLGTNPFGYPALSWASGPHGIPANRQPETPVTTGSTAMTAPLTASAADAQKTAPAAFYAPEAIPNADDILAVGKGAGSEQLHGFGDNTLIFKIISGQL